MIDKDNTPSVPSTEETESTEWTSPFEDLAEIPTATDGNATTTTPDDAHVAPHVIGTPLEDATHFPGMQNYTDTCAIRCQEFVLELYTNQDIPEEQLIQQALDHGWYAPGQGTAIKDVGNLLELNGIPVNRFEHASIFNLASELGQGHKVIIGIDSGELWGDNPVMEKIQDWFGLDTADHAVVVSGIDTTDPANPHVIVSDPGTGEALGSYPMAQFLDAWADSNFNMVSTQEPAPSYLPEMVNFDYNSGHIPEVAGMTWEDFQTFDEEPEAWENLFENELFTDSTDETPAVDESSSIADEALIPASGGSHETVNSQPEMMYVAPPNTSGSAPLIAPGTPYSDMPGASGHQALVDAGFQNEMDEIEREAFKADLDSMLDPKTFTNPYDD
jgi:hypothetical protein